MAERRRVPAVDAGTVSVTSASPAACRDGDRRAPKATVAALRPRAGSLVGASVTGVVPLFRIVIVRVPAKFAPSSAKPKLRFDGLELREPEAGIGRDHVTQGDDIGGDRRARRHQAAARAGHAVVRPPSQRDCRC